MDTQARPVIHSSNASSLVDVLERLLDKGIVVAGDITVKIVDIELLTIQIRLLVCSVDKAREMGMNWWMTNAYIGTAAVPPALSAAPATTTLAHPTGTAHAANETSTGKTEDATSAIELNQLAARISALECALESTLDRAAVTAPSSGADAAQTRS